MEQPFWQLEVFSFWVLVELMSSQVLTLESKQPPPQQLVQQRALVLLLVRVELRSSQEHGHPLDLGLYLVHGELEEE